MGRGRKISQKVELSFHMNPQALSAGNGAEEVKQLVKDLNLQVSDKLIDFAMDPSIRHQNSTREKLRQKHVSKSIVELAEAKQDVRKSQVKIQKSRDGLMDCEADSVMLGLKAKLLDRLAAGQSESDKDVEKKGNNDDNKGGENSNDTAMDENKERKHPDEAEPKKTGIVNLADMDLKKGTEQDQQENDNTEIETLSADSSEQNSESTEANDGVDEDSDEDDDTVFIDGRYSSLEEHMLPFFCLLNDGTFDTTMVVANRKIHKRIRKQMVKALLSQPELQRSMHKSPLLEAMKSIYTESVRKCSDMCTKTKGCRCEACKDTHEAVLEIMVGCFLHHFVGVEGVSRTKQTEDGAIVPVLYSKGLKEIGVKGGSE